MLFLNFSKKAILFKKKGANAQINSRTIISKTYSLKWNHEIKIKKNIIIVHTHKKKKIFKFHEDFIDFC